MPEDLGDKTEAPTGRRLSESRNKGQVAKSQDLGSAAGLFAAVFAVMLFGGRLTEGLGQMMAAVLGVELGAIDGDFLRPDAVRADIAQFSIQAALLVLPFMLVGFVAAYLVNLVQVGWLLTAEPLRPSLSKLNPIKGISRLFNRKSQVKTIVNLLKLVIVVAVAWRVVSGHLEELAVLPALPLTDGAKVVADACTDLALVLCVLLLVLAIADWLYQRWQHNQDLRMTKHQVKEERRSMDGDPQIKAKRMRMAQQIARQRVASAVPTADVIVTNPTHFSVAIKYDGETMRAPTVVAKGADEIALRIRQLARLAHVPIVERPPLARALYWGCDVGAEVSPEHYEAVAELLAYVYRLNETAASRPASLAPKDQPQPATA